MSTSFPEIIYSKPDRHDSHMMFKTNGTAVYWFKSNRVHNIMGRNAMNIAPIKAINIINGNMNPVINLARFLI